ncbi:hypothetical protein [Yimella sp. cx-51]|uniref:hypothetical protein n=1 Tax=Yimella sp. cx-51 TaxID=2770551 RepID=UPI00165E924A|nr:hypothetical protein [Yimella sp. cx-51]MBC9955465.1 hypothetical protein [Yimella sp. cx-51]MBD2759529.1 hypothetical protein [Yimella sp. cx-573]QTH37948.1 hypothetical protein J5M86_14085 [Yimella sp. cx-51]
MGEFLGLSARTKVIAGVVVTVFMAIGAISAAAAQEWWSALLFALVAGQAAFMTWGVRQRARNQTSDPAQHS